MSEALLSSSPPASAMNRGNAFDLLCACASAKPQLERVACTANWNFAGFDWSEFLRLAEHHGVLAMVARNLLQHATSLPGEIRQSLHSAYTENLRRNLWFAAELARILEHLAKREVRAIPYKGPVLAQSAYGDLGLRSFSDLDVLISPVDFGRAKETLGEIGYRPSHELSAPVERLFLRVGYERSFDGAAGKNLLELQWNLLPYLYAVDFRAAEFELEDLFARAERVWLGAAEISCLAPKDSLLVLCLHASKHLWTRLIWISDIAETLRAPELDFALIIARAREMGIARILGVSCWLANWLLGAAIPTAALDLIEHDSDVVKLGEQYAARIAQAATYDFESAKYFCEVWHLRERASDRWRYLWRLVWTPGPGEIASIALPEILFPLYRFVRIGRLLRKSL
jgi:fructose-specific component phosphotransferase system IIB-like protein